MDRADGLEDTRGVETALNSSTFVDLRILSR